MALSPYAQILHAVAHAGVSRSRQTVFVSLCLAFLAGAYVSFGGLAALRAGGMVPWEVLGTASKLVFASVFPIGLMLVILCGADLFTGNCMTLTAGRAFAGVPDARVLRSGVLAYIGNFAGAFFVTWTMVRWAGVLGDVVRAPDGTPSMPYSAALVNLLNAKGSLPWGEAFWRAVGCNWLVCLAIYATICIRDGAGRILGMWMPIMAFVIIGFEHSVANMFFLSAGMFAGTAPAYVELAAQGLAPALAVDWLSFLRGNLLPVTLGNIVGGSVFVTGVYGLAHLDELREAREHHRAS